MTSTLPRNPRQARKTTGSNTLPGKSWFAISRQYGPLEAWIDQSWSLGEIELVECPIRTSSLVIRS